MVKQAVDTSATSKKADSKRKPKASAKKKTEKKAKDSEDHDSENGAADEGHDSENGSADEGHDSENGSADPGRVKKASSKKAACKKDDTKPKAAAKSSAKNNDGKKGKNKIDNGEAGSFPTKRPIEKHPRKETALTEGWKKFSSDYIRDQKGTGKKLSQLMKEASEQWSAQLLLEKALKLFNPRCLRL